jgi:hypothetical protein
MGDVQQARRKSETRSREPQDARLVQTATLAILNVDKTQSPRAKLAAV